MSISWKLFKKAKKTFDFDKNLWLHFSKKLLDFSAIFLNLVREHVSDKTTNLSVFFLEIFTTQ